MAAPPRSSVFVFVMKDCGHCHEYVPRLRRVLQDAGFKGQVFVGDISSDRKAQGWAEAFGVSATPTTIAINSAGKQKKTLGAVTDAQIRKLLAAAAG